MTSKIKGNKQRAGTTAVEFALVAPIIFLFVFSIVEVSKVMMVDGTAQGAMVRGMREASIVSSTPASVEQVMRSEISRSGISEATIVFNPANFNHETEQISIEIEVPFTGKNGLGSLRVFSANSGIRKSINFNREMLE